MKNVHEIEIEIKGKEWEDILDETFKKKRKDVKIDGFRKGSVPKDVYLKKFGIESLYMDSVDEAYRIGYMQILEKDKLIPVCLPKVEIKHICADCITLIFKIITKPEVKLGDYKNLKIKKEKATVSKEELEREIESLRSRLADIVEKTEGELKDKETAVIDFEGFVDGKPLEGGSGNDFPLEIGSNTFIPGFESGLIGMKIGDKREINLKFPENYTEELKNKDVLFKVTLKGIKTRVLPELNKDFYEDLGMKDVKDEASFKAEVEKQIIARKEVDIENRYIEELLDKASNNMKIEINPEIIEEELERMIHQYEDQLKMQGLTLEQYFEWTKGNLDDLKKNMEPEALKRIKYRYLLEGISEAEKIEVSDEDASKEALEMAENYGMSKDDFLNEFGGIEMMKYDMQMRRAIEILKGDK